MSDNLEIIIVHPIEMDGFIRFLEAKSLQSKCPSCGSGTWVIVGDPETNLCSQLQIPGRDRGLMESLPVVCLHCENCGFIRQHMAHMVQEWIEENPEPSVDGEQAAEPAEDSSSGE